MLRCRFSISPTLPSSEATKRGYVTYEQLNAIMPSEEVTPRAD